jgi:hypothetical protein
METTESFVTYEFLASSPDDRASLRLIAGDAALTFDHIGLVIAISVNFCHFVCEYIAHLRIIWEGER